MAPRYVGPIIRKNHGRNHSYRDQNGAKVPGVTTIISDGVPKNALQGWAARTTADYAVNHWDELAEMPVADRLAKLGRARYDDRDGAANRGTRVHKLAEKLSTGQTVQVPDDLAGHVESYVAYLDDWSPGFELLEAVIMSHRHGYAGTLDAAAWFDPAQLLDAGVDDDQPGSPELLSSLVAAGEPALAIVDTKTARSGIFGEVALQLAGYRYADVYVADGVEVPMPQFHIALALHIRADGYDLIPMVAGPVQHRQLLYVREVARFATEDRAGYVGTRLEAPGKSQYRRLVVDPDAAAIGEPSTEVSS